MSEPWRHSFDQELGEKPTVSPYDVEWLDASVPMLGLPEKTAVLHVVDREVVADVDELERWLAFLCASLVVPHARPLWGLKFGAVTVVDLHVAGAQLDVIAAHGRLALLLVGPAPAGQPQPRVAKHQLELAVSLGARYSMDWAAAAWVLNLLEGE